LRGVADDPASSACNSSGQASSHSFSFRIVRSLRRRSAGQARTLEGLRGEDSIAELCRREGIVQNLYYRWSKEFLEAGKKRLAGDTARAATSDEVRDLREIAETHMAGSERFVCELCEHTTFADSEGASRFPFAFDKVAAGR
jgi:transposase